MKFLKLSTKDPYLNLAIEEYLYKKSYEEVFILWQNDPCVVIGKNQNPYAEINLNIANDNNIKIVRRITGGGAVYHDLGNLNYTFISPSHKQGIDFKYFTLPILSALNSLGVKAELSGRNDLILSNGKKISGNAQHSDGERVLHHGTLLFNSDLDFLDLILNVDPEKLKAKSVRSAHSRVDNILDNLNEKIDIQDFIRLISYHIINLYHPEIISPPSEEDVSELYRRNSSTEWIYPDRDLLSTYNIIRRKRFDFGTVELKISLKKDMITDINIYGDFFEKQPVVSLEKKLCGMCFSDPLLLNENVSDYILGMSNDDFIELLTYK